MRTEKQEPCRRLPLCRLLLRSEYFLRGRGRCRVGPGVSLGVSRLPSLPDKEVSRLEDEKREKVTLWEAAEYLDLTAGEVQDMVERGVLDAGKFAGAIHIPREEVERIERETAP
jgi:excisionase family DNA binding protein